MGVPVTRVAPASADDRWSISRLGLRVEQELAGQHDGLAFRQTAENRAQTVAFGTDGDIHCFEGAVLALYDHDTAFSRDDHRFAWHHEL